MESSYPHFEGCTNETLCFAMQFVLQACLHRDHPTHLQEQQCQCS
jgi:hypothetical protein